MTRRIRPSRTLIGVLAATAGLAVAAQLALEPRSAAAQRRPLQDLHVRLQDAPGPERELVQPRHSGRLAQAAEVKVGLPAGRRAGL